ncbi:MAG: Rrf2 family transcriptional regulator [Bacillota bacterium]|nr:Rrf2 family transcriptional regulator [Bacillota bacterium]
MINIKISTKGIYGIIAIMDVYIYSENKPVNIKSISERQDISDKYLEQLFRELKKAKLVKSKRGAYGGYILAKPAKEVYIKEVLDILEGSLSPVECVEFDSESKCSLYEKCVTKILWKKILDELNKFTKSISLFDLKTCIESYENQNHFNFNI